MSRLVLRRMKPRTVHKLQVDKCIWTMAPRPTCHSPWVDIRTMAPRPTCHSPWGDKSSWSSFSRTYKTLRPPLQRAIGTETKLNQEMAEKLNFYSAMKPTSLSISELLKEGWRKCPNAYFQFLRFCLPVRLANMIMELQHLPDELCKQPQFYEILHAYLDSFKKVLEFEVTESNEETHAKFLKCLIYIRRQHANTVPTMASAMKGMIMESGTSKKQIDAAKFQYFLDRLYLNHISINLLISNYREVHGDYHQPSSSPAGIIDPDCDLLSVAVSAYEAAAYVCDREYMDHPQLDIKGFDVTKMMTPIDKVNMAYIPSHLHHIFFEIFKNSMRATCEKNVTSYGGYGEGKLDNIHCTMYKSKNDISIKISDFGGGINHDTVKHVFDYQYTTAKHVAKNSSTDSSNAGLQSPYYPMHGLGYGLPLSRLYARYFQGDLKIASVEGYGTDVYIYLKALSDDATEQLPNYNQKAVHKLSSQSSNESDWTR